MELRDDEHKLVGQWIFENGRMVKDAVTNRIEELINFRLEKITSDRSGWDVLYVDPNTRRLWELTYPSGELQGGGPPTLTSITVQEATGKYGIKDV